MASAKGGQKFIKENRAPRVHIEYEVETYGSRQKVELPFVMGVMSDLSGKSLVEKKTLDKRDFVEFDMDNFDQKMEAIAPRAAFVVDNTLSGDGKMAVDLTFKSLDDFSPDAVARQVKPLRELLELRTKLADLRGSLQGNDKLEEILQNTLNDAEKMSKLRSEMGITEGAN